MTSAFSGKTLLASALLHSVFQGQICLLWTKRRRMRAGTLSAAERSYPKSKIRGRGLECQAAMMPEQPRGATLRLRSGVADERSYPEAEVRGDGWEEPPTLQPRANGGEKQPEERWLRRHRRA